MHHKRTYVERACAICGDAFTTRKDQKSVTCSVPCRMTIRRERYALSPGEMFARHYVPPVGDGCSGWTGPRDGNGYATFWACHGGKAKTRMYAHTYVWNQTSPPIVKGEVTRHLCGNGHLGCARREHLDRGTRLDNTRDARKIGRLRRILTLESARDIRIQWSEGNTTIMELAANHFVKTDMIRRVIAGKAWEYAGGPLGGFTRPRGETHGMARLTPDAVRSIRKERADGAKPSDIARRYGVSASAVTAIVSRKRWAHVI